MFNLNSYLSEKNRQVNAALERFLSRSRTGRESRIAEAMRYSLMAGGKRIRPVLVLATAEAVAGRVEGDVLSTACAIEMIHTYSLIHDDLPAMDNDELRRGKPTCHVAYDEATAILAGDALLTMAFEVLSSIKTKHPSRLLNVMHIIARASGYQGMIEGQMRDIISEGILLDLNALEEMHILKTGAMIRASVSSGAILGGGSEKEIRHLELYAKNIGLTFQITDDLLNIEGDPALLGKAVGTDNAREKNTYPSITGIEASKTLAKNMTENALHALDIFDSKSDPLRAIAAYIIERKR